MLIIPEFRQVPLIGFIGRLDYQKGADLVLGAVPWLMEQDVQLVCLGTGDVSLEVKIDPSPNRLHPQSSLVFMYKDTPCTLCCISKVPAYVLD